MPEVQMEKLAIAPSAALRPYVQRFLIVEYFTGFKNTLLPDAGIVAAFRFKGTCLVNGASAPNLLVTGLRDSARKLTHSGGCGNVVVLFTPLGAAEFLREPVEELFNGTMPFEYQVRRSHLDLVEEQLAEAPDHRRRVDLVEHFLLEQQRRRETDPLVAAAVTRIHNLRGSLRIDGLARHAGLSQSALERRFRRAVGTTPKKFAAIVRLRNVMRLRQSGASLTEIAYAAGYADQPHFIKDFKRFAGEAPESFFQSTTAFC
jgi:AraC-like DNA-binding protein